MKPKLIALALTFALTTATTAQAHDIILAWDHSPDRAELSGYRVYAGTNAGFALSNATFSVAVGPGTTNATVTNMTGKLWFKATAFTAAAESDPSNEVMVLIPRPPTLRVSSTFQAAADPAGPWRDIVVMPDKIIWTTNAASEFFRMILNVQPEAQ